MGRSLPAGPVSADPGGVPPGVSKFGYDPRVNWKLAVPVLAAVALAACSQAESATPGILAADPWVRATVGTEMPEMTALFVNLYSVTRGLNRWLALKQLLDLLRDRVDVAERGVTIPDYPELGEFTAAPGYPLSDKGIAKFYGFQSP